MYWFFVVGYGIIIALLLGSIIRSRSLAPLFAPWPGFPFIFSTYYILGTQALDAPVTELQWALYCLAIIGCAVGAAFAYSLPMPNGDPEERQRAKTEQFKAFTESLNFPLLGLFCAMGMIATSYLWVSAGIPALSSNVNAARQAFLSNGYIATVATLLDVSAVFAFAYIMAFGWKPKHKKVLLAFGIIALFLIVAILAGSRSRLLKFAVPCIFIYHYFGRGIRLREVAVLAAFVVLFVGGVGYFRNATQYGASIVQGIGGDSASWSSLDFTMYFLLKELSTAAYGLDLVIKYIPDMRDHTWGMLHIGPIVAPLGGGIPNPGEFFKAMVGGRWDGFGLAATFLAPMYSDFGVMGVLVLTAIYMSVYTFVFRATLVGRNNAPYWANLYAMLFFFMVSGVRSDVVSFEVAWFMGAAVFIMIARRKVAEPTQGLVAQQ